MEFLNKLITILILFVVIFFWNKYIVEYIFNRPEKFHRKYNEENLNKQPIKFYLENKRNLIKFAKWFYWFSFIILTLFILVNKIPPKEFF